MCPNSMDQLTQDQKAAYRRETECHICKQSIFSGQIKVRDHCHLTGKYRGSAHEECNLKYQDSRTIPVVFHNSSGYDAHFIIRDICTHFYGKVDLLPLNKKNILLLQSMFLNLLTRTLSPILNLGRLGSIFCFVYENVARVPPHL